LTKNAKTYEAKENKQGGIGCGMRFGSRARAVDYVYNPLPIYFYGRYLLVRLPIYFCYGIGSHIQIVSL